MDDLREWLVMVSLDVELLGPKLHCTALLQRRDETDSPGDCARSAAGSSEATHHLCP